MVADPLVFIAERKVLPFAGGVSPPFPVVSLLFSVSYPQASRSYYLFFNYLFFNYLYGGAKGPSFWGGGGCERPVFLGGGGCEKPVENRLDSHKPVETGDLRLLTIQGRRGVPRVQSGAGRLLTGR